MVPARLPFIILKECGFVVGDKDEATQIGCMRKEISVIIPNLESCFVFRPSMHKRVSIGHNVILFMFINIHTILYFAVAPLHLYEPPLCCRQWNPRLVNSQPRKQDLEPLACNNLTDILCFDKTTLCPLGQLSLDLLQDVLILKNSFLVISIGMGWKHPLLDKVKNSGPDAVCTGWSMSLCLCHNYRSLPLGVPKLRIQKKIQDPNHGRDTSLKNDIERFVMAQRQQSLPGPWQCCNITQQFQCIVHWAWQELVCWNISLVEVIKECLGCTLCSIGTQHCLAYCFGMPINILTCCVLGVLPFLFSG